MGVVALGQGAEVPIRLTGLQPVFNLRCLAASHVAIVADQVGGQPSREGLGIVARLVPLEALRPFFRVEQSNLGGELDRLVAVEYVTGPLGGDAYFGQIGQA